MHKVQDSSFPVVYVERECLAELVKKLKNDNRTAELSLHENIESYVNEKQVVYVNKKDKYFCTNSQNGLSKFIEVVYEKVLDFIIDLKRKKVLCTVMILMPRLTEAILIDKDRHVEIMEIRGKQVFPLVDIGQSVYENTKLCHIVTKKYEVRVIRSPIKGAVFYIGEAFLVSDKALYIVIAGENDVVKLTRNC